MPSPFGENALGICSAFNTLMVMSSDALQPSPEVAVSLYVISSAGDALGCRMAALFNAVAGYHT